MLKKILFSVVLFFVFYANYSQCGYQGNLSGSVQSICYNRENPDTNVGLVTFTNVRLQRHVRVNVIQGLMYNFTTTATDLNFRKRLSLYNSAGTYIMQSNASADNTAVNFTWTATFTGVVCVQYNVRNDCDEAGDNSDRTDITVTFVGGSNNNISDPQTAEGTNSWIGHVYDFSNDTNVVPVAPSDANAFANYLGYFAQANTNSGGVIGFNQNYGGDDTCFAFTAGGTSQTVRTDSYAVRYRMKTTTASFPVGCYIAKITGDDGVRLSVDGVLVFDAWAQQSSTEYNNVLIYLKNNSQLIFDYYEKNGGNVSNITITPVGTTISSLNTVPSTAVSRCGSATATTTIDGSSIPYVGTNPNPSVKFQWQSSTNNVTFTNIAINATSEDYVVPASNPASVTTIYYRRTISAAASNASACSYDSNSIAVTTSPASVGGTVSPASTCLQTAANSVTLTLSGHTGSVIRWESSTDNFATTPTSITNNTTSLPLTNVARTTYYRAIVQSGSCSTATSSVATVITGPVTASPATAITCAGFTANWAKVTGATTYLLDVSTNNFASFVGIYNGYSVGDNASFVVSGLTANTTYQYRISPVYTCGTYSTPSTPVSVLVKAAISKTWNGSSWIGGIPNGLDQNIEFAGNYSNTEVLTGCSCLVTSGNVVIQSSQTMTLQNALRVSGGTLKFSDKSSLIQTDNVQNTGNITYERTTPNVRRYDFTFWSTPVWLTANNGPALNVFSPLTYIDKYHSYNGTAWVYETPSNTMKVGKGYNIRAPQTNDIVVASPFPGSFTGVPNNGNIDGESVVAGNYYLAGNPYPSAIDIDKFLKDPNNILVLEGTLEFWSHGNPPVYDAPSGKYKYVSSDYLAYNSTGGIGSGPGVYPDAVITSGQSVSVKVRDNAPVGSKIVFTNAMRVGVAGKNGQFFKPGKTDAVADEKTRMWINFTDESGLFKQMLLGYFDDATNSYEDNYDAYSSGANGFADFYTISEGDNFAIQGRTTFDNTDVVPVGYSLSNEGTYTITVAKIEGLLAESEIYLEDKTLGKVHNLKDAPYTFESTKGVFNDRFSIKYTNKTLGTGDFEKTENGVTVAVKEKIIKVQSSLQNLKSVTVFDVSGKLLYQKTKVGATSLSIEKLRSSNQILLVKVVLDNNFETTKKIIFN